MCNRYVSPGEGDMERFWHIGRHNVNRGWESAAIFPRAQGPFIRTLTESPERELVIGQWGLIPWFAKAAQLPYSTNNARFEEITDKASYKQSWAKGYRCIIPAMSFDEPCWDTGKNVWWNFRRADGAPWGLAGLWNSWIDKATGSIHESYTMLTLNADDHPLMSRMHKPDPKLPADQQDKRSVVAIELADVDAWLRGSIDEASELVRVPAVEVFNAAPIEQQSHG
jgi:putative SOS response-associated peptidase YedK